MKKVLLLTLFFISGISFGQTTGGIPTSPLTLGTTHDLSGVDNNTDIPATDWYTNNGVNNFRVVTETIRMQYKAYAADGTDHNQLGRDKLSGIQANVSINTDYTLTADLEWCGMRVFAGTYDGTNVTRGAELGSFAFVNTNTTRETRTVSFNSGANTTILIEFFLPGNNVSANTTGTQGTVIVYDFAWIDNIKLEAAASTVTWTGATADWATATNWDTNTVPTAADNVVIPEVTNAPIIGATTAAVANDLTITEADGVTINSGGTLIVSGTATGNVNYIRNLTTGTQWYLMSSPVAGENYDDSWVTDNAIPSSTQDTGNRGISWYDNSSSDTDSDGALTDDSATGYWRYMAGGTSSPFAAGRGYGIIRSSSGDIEFKGTGIHTTDQTFTLEQGENNFNLIGNPYPAFITLGTFYTTNSANIGTNFYFYDGSTYVTLTSGNDPTYEIAPSQGFFVEATSTNDVTFEVSDLSHQGDTFQKSTNTRPEIILNVQEGNNKRFAKIYYNNATSEGFDAGYDGKLFGGISHSFALYSQLISGDDSNKYQVQSLPDSGYDNMVIPVGMIVASGKEITFTAEASNIPSGLKVYLEDRQENTFTQLDVANAEYKVTLKEAANGIGRFYLHTKSAAVLSTDDVLLNSVSIFKSNASTLKIAGLQNGKASISLFNILGKNVMNTSFNSSNGVQEITLPKLATGVYIVQLQTEAGKLNKKIILE